MRCSDQKAKNRIQRVRAEEAMLGSVKHFGSLTYYPLAIQLSLALV